MKNYRIEGYRATSDGKIFSIIHNWRGYGEREMVHSTSIHGYKTVRLTVNGKRRKPLSGEESNAPALFRKGLLRMKASKLPWKFGIAYQPERGEVPYDYSSGGHFGNPAIMDSEGESVVGCNEYDVFHGKTPEERAERIRLIVTAVNNHARLVESLRKVTGMFVDTKKYPDPETIVTAIRIWYPEARVLLAEIEKEKQG